MCSTSKIRRATIRLSVLIATILVVAIFVLGTLAVAVVIPAKGHRYEPESAGRLSRAVGRVRPALARQCHGRDVGVGRASARSASSSPGPPPGSWRSARPAIFRTALQKTNAHGIPVPILLLQGFVITLLCVAFTVLPSVQSAYQILSQMATIIYLVMYLMMYVAAIRLRYTQPDKLRPFRDTRRQFRHVVRRDRRLARRVDRHSPSVSSRLTQISTGSPVVYIGILLVGCAVFVAIPFLLYAFHKPTWKAAEFGLRTFRVANQSQKAGIEQQAFPCSVPQVKEYPAKPAGRPKSDRVRSAVRLKVFAATRS